MSFIRKALMIAVSIGILLFVVPLFAVLGLAAIGVMLVSSVVGALVLRHKVEKDDQSSFAKAYYEQRSAFQA